MLYCERRNTYPLISQATDNHANPVFRHLSSRSAISGWLPVFIAFYPAASNTSPTLDHRAESPPQFLPGVSHRLSQRLPPTGFKQFPLSRLGRHLRTVI